jgi:hypothetical protein
MFIVIPSGTKRSGVESRPWLRRLTASEDLPPCLQNMVEGKINHDFASQAGRFLDSLQANYAFRSLLRNSPSRELWPVSHRATAGTVGTPARTLSNNLSCICQFLIS